MSDTQHVFRHLDRRSVVVLVPTRGRPQQLGELLYSIEATATLPNLNVVVAICEDDPTAHQYNALGIDFRERWHFPGLYGVRFPPPPDGQHRGFVYPLNWMADQMPPVAAYAVLGDDHRPRTQGWDERLFNALTEAPSFAYGNDLVHGQGLPTSVMMSGAVHDTLGFIAPPCLGHLYVDNTWKAWGQALGQLRYLDDVVIEHMHPLVGKAPDDDTYAAVRAGEECDTQAWLTYSQTAVQPAWTKPEFGELPKTPLELDIASLKGWQR